jgi:hypothetical protein
VKLQTKLANGISAVLAIIGLGLIAIWLIGTLAF